MLEERPKLSIRQEQTYCVVEFEARKILEELAINEIGEKLAQLAEARPQPKVLLDFKNVQHLSSAALGMLIELNKQVMGRKGQLVLANINPQIYEVFRITRLNKLFNIQSTTEDAIKALT